MNAARRGRPEEFRKGRTKPVREISCMKFADFVCRDAIRAHLAAERQGRGHPRDGPGAGGCGKGRSRRVREHRQGHPQARRTGQHRHRPGRGRARTPSIPASIAWSAPWPSAATGVDFASLDGETVHLFFLLISPPDRPGDHLRALENISRQLRDDTFCRFLKQAKTRGRHPATVGGGRQPPVRLVIRAPEPPRPWPTMPETTVTRTVLVANRAGVARPRRRHDRRAGAPFRRRSRWPRATTGSRAPTCCRSCRWGPRPGEELSLEATGETPSGDGVAGRVVSRQVR